MAKDYNIVLILDVSGSMQGNKLDMLKQAVNNLMQDFQNYNGGDVKVHIVPFATSAQAGATFTLNADGTGSGYTDAVNFINGLVANGSTNYEAPMQDAIGWLQSGVALGVDRVEVGGRHHAAVLFLRPRQRRRG